jgi:ATP/maltotriose-dependent transcriptional regulator MalT/DNA-binding SARP family transcriptional activator
VFGRPRLFARLDACAALPLAWIAGPPGSGKTTLAASWLKTVAAPSAWLHLDAADGDPATFFLYVGIAAQALGGRRALRLPGISTDDLRDLAGFARRLLRALSARCPQGWTLVLDNYHELDADSPVHAALAACLAEVPTGARLLVVGREPPGAAYARAASSQLIGAIDADAMRLTMEETGALVALHGGTVAVPALHEATDGWAAGQILMLAADAPLTDTGGSRETVFAYFAGEVLARMPPGQQLALSKVALLPGATEAVAIALGGDPAAGRVLAELHRRNLFVGRRAQKDPVYVFHALFREFLLARLAATHDAQALAALQRRAAALLAAEGDADGAMRLLLAARAFDEAERLLDAHAAAFLAQGRTRPLLQWLAALPDSTRERPRTLYWRACCEIEARPQEAGQRFERAWAGFSAAGDAVGQLMAAAGAAEAIVLQAADFQSLDRWIAVFESLAPSYFSIPDPLTELRVLPGMLAAFVARRAEHRLTTLLSDRAELLLEREEAASHRLLLGSVAWCFLDAGQHERVGRLLANLGRLRADQPVSPATDLRWRHVEVLWKTLVGRLDEALADALEAERIASGAGAVHLRAATDLMVAQAAWCAGAGAIARRHLDAARSAIPPARTLDRCVLAFLDGMVALSEGDAAAALPSLRQAVALAQVTGSPGRERIASFGLALAATAAGELDAAETALAAATRDASFGQVRFHRWVVAMVEAGLADRRGDLLRCLGALRNGFALAREGGYCYAPAPFSSPGLMPRLCALALRHGIESAHVRHLIRETALPAPADADASWPWQVRILTLGGFGIELDGRPLQGSRKAQRKPLDLLRLIVAGGVGGTGARAAAQALWPDATGDAAQNSLDNTLLRLRRLLGDDRCVVLYDGTLTLDAALCWVDAHALEADCDAIERGLRRGDQDHEALERVLTLYRGPFLPGDDELAPLLAARERLRSRMLRHLGSAAAHEEAGGRPERAIALYRRVLEQDLLAEDVALHLMRCLIACDRTAEAWDAYRRLRDHLSIVLGIRPSAATEALAARLKRS